MLSSKIGKLFRENSRTLIITIGNPLRSDDGVGPYIYEHIKEGGKFLTLNAQDRPESIIDEAVSLKPEKTIFIDAADFNGKTGEVRIIEEKDIPDSTLSTHAFPIPVIAGILREDTGSEVYFLGIQAKSMELSHGLCPEIKESADTLISLIKEK